MAAWSSNKKWTVLCFLLWITVTCMLYQNQTTFRYIKTFLDNSTGFLSSKTCACQKCLTDYHPWFLERFNKSVNPFLTRENSLSSEAYNWWKNLQNDHAGFTGYRQVEEKLFGTFPIGADFVDPRPDRCRTCAVVGNSDNLKGSRYGPMIDINDVVIRMNGARTKGFEADVGSRTTLHVMYPESAVDLANTTHLVLFPYKTPDIRWLISALTTGSLKFMSYKQAKARITANKDLVMVLNPAFMKYVHEKWLEKHGSYPSTGILTLVLSLHICDEVNVFGYGADKDGNWNHYWEVIESKHHRSAQHNRNYEYNLLTELSDHEKLQMFRG
ncbi:CMP-N-acetylneuraminate-beta-galactosamide-alpha-2,3-sialyltransferase 1-like [Lampris incognitus]|uniref:CMP-N-acetylneuraminate-beta-galactosamide- alpha-2,3-sialyltransferase 1-like n=1 Tax=Lampris incognitus TaxID=2546036 RepID=UPI0024B5537B|nr:CMP-N-acetylneuraminate-beta-galactosamide-alpha-2,3-sialyltransferase 1-like [Lampris incognitus]